MKSSISRIGRLALPYAEENPGEVVAALDDKTEAVIRTLEARHKEARRSLAPRRDRLRGPPTLPREDVPGSHGMVLTSQHRAGRERGAPDASVHATEAARAARKTEMRRVAPSQRRRSGPRCHSPVWASRVLLAPKVTTTALLVDGWRMSISQTANRWPSTLTGERDSRASDRAMIGARGTRFGDPARPDCTSPFRIDRYDEQVADITCSACHSVGVAVSAHVCFTWIQAVAY